MYSDLKKRNETRRLYRLKNIERERERERSRKARELANRPEVVRARFKKYYDNDANAAAKQNERRQRREPNRIIRAAEKLFSQGVIGVDECIKRIDYAIECSNKAVICATGSESKKDIGSV